MEQSLQYHDVLNPAIWENNKMIPAVRNALMKNADNFIEALAPYIDASMVKDICLTGSNANFNYNRGSDCDVHLMIAFPSKMHEDFALAKKTVWNSQNKISIHGFPVEMYPQDDDEAPVAGSGWYSIKNDQWIHQPTHQNDVDMDNPSIMETANKIAKQINFVVEYKVTSMPVLHRLGEKIWGLRDQSKNGEFSINNLAFKELRNSGLTDKYTGYLQEVQNKQLSLA